MKDLGKRLPTTAALIVFAYVSIRFLPVIYFAVLLYLLISLAVLELIKLTRPQTYSWPLIFANGLLIGLAFTVKQIDLLYALMVILIVNGLFFLFTCKSQERLASFVRDWGILWLTTVYLYLPLFFLLELKKIGANYLFFLILVIAVGDSGAYFVGSAIGKHKIYPVASPKKSLEGLLAAVPTAIGLFSQLSDPVESLFKRAAGQKDSGVLLPGHGGVLDRVDSYIFCAPLLFYLIRFFWK
jgi:phosphatidate cytidylyltransferase